MIRRFDNPIGNANETFLTLKSLSGNSNGPARHRVATDPPDMLQQRNGPRTERVGSRPGRLGPLRVDLKLFAVARQRAGAHSLTLELPDAATVADLKAALAEACPCSGRSCRA